MAVAFFFQAFGQSPESPQLVKTYGRGTFLELVSNDAGITSADNARLVNDAGVGYLMAVKGDQPTLFEEAQRLLGAGAKKQAGQAGQSCAHALLGPRHGVQRFETAP